MKKNIVIVKSDIYSYPPKKDLFRPHKTYEEYLWKGDISLSNNNVYDMIRKGFILGKYDMENFGTEKWNPLSFLIKPGDNVLIKPNMVMDENHVKEFGTDCLYTNPSLVACIIDYVIIALDGKGSIVVGDAPMQECNFDKLISESGYKDLIDFYKKKLFGTEISINLVDFRGLKTKRVNGVNQSEEVPIQGTIVDLKEESEFFGEDEKKLDKMRITNYDPELLKQHHNVQKNEYFINDYVLNADVIINMPKPKTHRKAGVTISMKNLVGINCRKEFLPHHTIGSKEEGGDEYLHRSLFKHWLDLLCDKRNYYQQTQKAYKKAWLLNKVYRILTELSKLEHKDSFYEGSWYGNDTISKTIVDLNKILFYADKNGTIKESKQRKIFIVADMIISGEKEGPVMPSPKNVGIIAIGEDPVCFDEAIMTLMGAKKEYIHTLSHAKNTRGKLKIYENNDYPYLISNEDKWNEKKLEELNSDDLLYFIPTSGWEEAFLRGSTN